LAPAIASLSAPEAGIPPVTPSATHVACFPWTKEQETWTVHWLPTHSVETTFAFTVPQAFFPRRHTPLPSHPSFVHASPSASHGVNASFGAGAGQVVVDPSHIAASAQSVSWAHS
jgi:hypothetical protein